MHYPCIAECNHAPKQAWNALRAASVPACLLSTRTCNYQQWRVWIRRMIQPFFKIASLNPAVVSVFDSKKCLLEPDRCLQCLVQRAISFWMTLSPRQHCLFELVSQIMRGRKKLRRREAPYEWRLKQVRCGQNVWMKGVNSTDDSTIF